MLVWSIKKGTTVNHKLNIGQASILYVMHPSTHPLYPVFSPAHPSTHASDRTFDSISPISQSPADIREPILDPEFALTGITMFLKALSRHMI